MGLDKRWGGREDTEKRDTDHCSLQLIGETDGHEMCSTIAEGTIN